MSLPVLGARDLSHIRAWHDSFENWKGSCPWEGMPHGSCWHWDGARTTRPADVLCSAFSQSPGSRPRQICQSNPTHCLAGKAEAWDWQWLSHSSCYESVPRGRGDQSHLSLPTPSLYNLKQATLPLQVASHPHLRVGDGSDGVSPSTVWVVTVTGSFSRNPLRHQKLPIKQASPKAGMRAKNLVTTGFLAVARWGRARRNLERLALK